MGGESGAHVCASGVMLRKTGAGVLFGFQTMRSVSLKKKEKKNSPGAENSEIDFFDFQIFTFSVFNFMFLLEYS